MAQSVETLIVGAGLAGLCMATKLKQAGRNSFLVVEKSAELGGTWADNKYPGCECDIPSHLYSYSFYQNPNWTTAFASRGEIQSYLQSCAIHYGLLPDNVRFHTRATAAVWDKDKALWRIELVNRDGGEPSVIMSRFLVSAVGALSVPKLPSVEGIETFQGSSIHSSQWTTSVEELRGKRVCVVGTGASAIQIVPEVASVVEKLYVVQRTPAWILPKPGFGISSSWKWIFNRLPLAMWLWRSAIFCVMEFLGSGAYGGAVFPFSTIRKALEKAAKLNMQMYIKDTALRKRLTPAYEMGCRRALLSSEFYPALARDNVEVISGSLVEVRQRSIVVQTYHNHKMEMDLDVIIYATGFDLFQPKIHVLGSNIHIEAASPIFFLGITKHGFPNFFSMMGHNSVILMMEAQARYILSCMDLLKQDSGSLEVKLSSQQRFQEFLDRRFPKTVWRSGSCRSWYFDSKTGQNPFIWPASVIEYMFYTLSASVDDYDISYIEDKH